ncbi:hypothetical protein AB0K51_05155 [Kitasatospora sp. NPDC049285]|uniref:hypothetical protein n=1 Tax=Kitasatospora sp. NPDC049285 TaxID=3157096 RepID=UPI0034359C90
MGLAEALWSAESAGLATGGVAGLGTAAPRRAEAGAVVTAMVRPPDYRPYRSTRIPCDPEGLAAAREALVAARSPGLRDALLAGPVGDTLRRVAGRHAATLWDQGGGRTARGLAGLAAVSPSKGGEANRLWTEYRRRNPGSVDQVMTMRDYLGAVYSWTFPRAGLDQLDLFASMLCFTLAADFVGAADGSGVDSAEPYLRAAGEGYARLTGSAPDLMAREMALGAALTYLKDELQEDAAKGTLSLDRDEPAATPEDCVVSRWWEGFYPPLVRVVAGSAGYRHLAGLDGTFRPAVSCPSTARVLTSVLRYDDVIDAVPDALNHETGNEFLSALAHHGPEATADYGHALAASTDAALACDCGVPGHDEAAEHAMGFSVFYPLIPRYNVRRQLLAYQRTGGDTARAAAPPAPGTRLRTVRPAPGTALHTPDWAAAWQPHRRTVEETAHLVTRRMLAGTAAPAGCIAAAASVLARCDQADDLDAYRQLAGGWQQSFDTALAANGLYGIAPAAALREAIGAIWGHIALAAAADRDAALFIDTDLAVRATYRLAPADGHRLRRAFFGVVSSSLELSGFNPYQRLAHTVSAACR